MSGPTLFTFEVSTYTTPRAMTFCPDGAYVDGVKVPGFAEWIATGEYPDPGASAEGKPADPTEES